MLLRVCFRYSTSYQIIKTAHRLASTCPQLVSCGYLEERMNSPRFLNKYQILDATWDFPSTGRDPRREFINTRIPGAKFFDIEECSDHNTNLPHMLPNVKEFEEYVSRLGISNSQHIIVYDNQPHYGLFTAPRVWWMFKVFGHDLVSVLDGGLPKWMDSGYKTECGEESQDKDKGNSMCFKAKFQRELVRDLDFMKKNLTSEKTVQVVDARSNERFRGLSPDPRKNIPSGHIPKSFNIPFKDCLTPDTKIMKSAAELRKVFADNGVVVSRDMVASCGSGISAAIVALAAKLCSGQDVPIYDGSWSEWALKMPNEIKKGN